MLFFALGSLAPEVPMKLRKVAMRKSIGTGATVLVVDDEDVDRADIKDALMSNGYTVLEANSYGDAMAVFDLNRDAVELLVADVSLPDGDGCALAITLRRQKPDLRVLFVSFHVGAEVCKTYGLDVDSLHFLGKPFAENELAARVRRVLVSATPFPRLYGPKTRTSSGDPNYWG
jgi:DNA-binding response OmpR family regulator